MNRHAMRQLIVQTLYQIETRNAEKDDAIAVIEAFVKDLQKEATEEQDIISGIIAYIEKNKENTETEEITFDDTTADNSHLDVLESAFTIEAYYFTTVEGILNNIEKIDAVLTAHLEGWNLSRINKVDKAILRLAVYEMTKGGTPINIAINEAIELTKNFTDVGDKKSSGFNNRLLDKIATSLKMSKE